MRIFRSPTRKLDSTALYNDWVFNSISSLHHCGSRRGIEGGGGRPSP
jgi:hypothetical protein